MKEKFEQEQKDRQNHIEDLIPDMPDMEDDEKFRQWLEETYINEAELIEKSLLAGQEYEKNPDIAEELKLPEMLWRRRTMILCQRQPGRKLSLWRREPRRRLVAQQGQQQVSIRP